MQTTTTGFSLIEIMIAVTIIGIMLAVVVPNFMRYREKSRMTGTKAALVSVNAAIDQFHSDTNVYPSTLADLMTKPGEEKVARKWEGPYLTKEAVDSFGNELVYQLNAKGTQPAYELYSWGPHGEGSPQEEWIRFQDI
jgi:general secretion pathway protein G